MAKAYTIPTVFTAVDKVTQTVGKITLALSRMDRAYRKMTQPIREIGKLFNTGFLSGYIGIYGAYRAIKGMVDIMADFQQANADLAAIMVGATRPQLKLLSEDAKRLGLSTAKTATEIVKLQTELGKAGYGTSDILKMTKPLIQGSVAMGAELETITDLVSSTKSTFGKFGQDLDAGTMIDQMTLSTVRTLSSFEKLNTALRLSSANAAASGVPFTKLVALLGELFDAGVDASSAGTALRNVFADSAKRGHTYTQDLDKINASLNKLKTGFKLFGKRGMTQALVLAMDKGNVAIEETILKTQALGVAANISSQRLDTFKGQWKLLTSAYESFILSIEDGTGKYAAWLTQLEKTARAMLLISTNTPMARAELNKLDQETRDKAEKWMAWGKAIMYVVGGLILINSTAKLLTSLTTIWAALEVAWKAFATIFTSQNVWAVMSRNLGRFLAEFAIWGSAIKGALEGFLYGFDETINYLFEGKIIKSLKRFLLIIPEMILMAIDKISDLVEFATFGWIKNDHFYKGLRDDMLSGVGLDDRLFKQIDREQRVANAFSVGKYQQGIPDDYKQLYIPAQSMRDETIRRDIETQRQNVTIGFENPPKGMKVSSDNDIVKINNGGSNMSPWRQD